MSFGMTVTFGGVPVPDYQVSAIIGTAFAALCGQAQAQAASIGIAVAVLVLLLMALFDAAVRVRALNTKFMHRAERALERQDEAAFTCWHLSAQVAWGLERAIPVFLAIWCGAGPARRLLAAFPVWAYGSVGAVSSLMPAFGFGVLLTFLPVEQFWPFFVLGFVMFAYLHTPLVGILVTACAVVALFSSLAPATVFGNQAEGEDGTGSNPVPGSPVRRADLVKAMWRHNLALQLSWNYENAMGLGYAWSIAPVLKRLYPQRADYYAALRRHMAFYNANPAVGSPTIFGADCALEEQGQAEAGDRLKPSLMGPFAGIGDTMMSILINPFCGIFAASLALRGNAVGAWLIVMLGLFWTLVRIPGFWLGYRQGLGVVRLVNSGIITHVIESGSAVLLFLLGGAIPAMLSGVQTPLRLTEHVMLAGKEVIQIVELQNVLDRLLPYVLPLAVTCAVYLLLKKRHWTALRVLEVLAVVGAVLGGLGILRQGERRNTGDREKGDRTCQKESQSFLE